VRRVVELTGLGIAATYFLDPTHGVERRRAALGWIAGARGVRGNEQSLQAVAGAATPVAAPEKPVALESEPTSDEPPQLPEASQELVLLSRAQLAEKARTRRDVEWPAWGWALVITITICAVAAFAAVGLGIWAIKHRTSTTTRTVIAPATSAAPVLADPAAARIVGSAKQGRVLLRVDAAGAALAVDGLPPLSGGRLYRVWITNGGTTTATGDFVGQRAVLALKPLASASRLRITREAAGAAPDAPRGPQVAIVTVRP
jgi:hypothetical protein